ncbi:uncharacterized protein crybg2 [Brachyistius frenatus]|uniref:uncharacterized protein crybg2 n=1 Tax=Brachyistius frenatus TaxID=100188 RepID=UPI0037E7DF64
MAKKGPSTRKTLKSFFSKSEASLGESVDKDADKNEGEKKKFKFFKFKIKSRSGSASEKSANEDQRVLSAVEPSNTDGETWTDNIVPDNKRPSLYATAPRAKGKEFSYSELDLRKPKRFASFSFGLRKRKKKDQENISKSIFGLHSQGIEEQDETPVDLSQMELGQTNTKMMFSMSQPELDSSNTFDIPSPPPVATNKSESYFTFPNQSHSSVTINTQPESNRPLTNGFDILDVPEENLKAPIASIPELELDYPGSSEKKETIPVHIDSSKSDAKSSPTTRTQTPSVVNTQTAPGLSSSQPPIVLHTTDHKAAAVDSALPSNDPSDNVILLEFNKNTESTGVSLSHHHPDAPHTAESAISKSDPSLASVDSKNDTTVTESASVHHAADTPSIHNEVLISRTPPVCRPPPETAKSVATTSAVSGEKSVRLVSQYAVYGALYDSLFPKSFTAEIISSLLSPSPQIRTEIRHHDTKTEPVVVKTLNECHTETNIIYSRLSTSHEFESAARRMNDTGDVFASPSERQTISLSESSGFTSYQTSGASRHERHLEQPSSPDSGPKPDDGDNIPYSELTRSSSEGISDSSSLVRDIVRSVPVCQNSPPPASDWVASRGTDTQVTGSKRRVILLKELVTDEEGAAAGCPSAEPDKMSAVKELELNIQTESLSDSFGQTDDGPQSPVYLSMGSDDGIAVEIYYSAEEDNTVGSGEEEMFTTGEGEETIVADGRKDVALRADAAEGGMSGRDEGDVRVVIVRMEHEGRTGSEEKTEDCSSRTEVQQQLRMEETGTTEFLVGNDAESQEEEAETAAQPQMKEDKRKERRKEELPATPVQQVNTLMVCDLASPAGEMHGQREGSEGNWTVDLETEDRPNGDKQLPRKEGQYQAHEDIRSSEYIHSTGSNTREEDGITPSLTGAEAQVSLTAETEKRDEASKESIKTSSIATNGALTDTSGAAEVDAENVTHSPELQSDATQIEHNRAPQSSEWADTITQSPDTNITAREQVAAVELSAPNKDAHHPDGQAAEAPSESREHPTEARPDLTQGSPTASRTAAAASEDFASESHHTKDDQESVGKMNSGYSILSTRLSIKNLSPPKEDESKYRFHKMSLISEAEPTDVSRDTVDFDRKSTPVTESDVTDPSLEYKWRNKFEGVTQYKPNTTENSSLHDSLSYRASDTWTMSSSSALPEPTAYKHLSNTFPSSLPPEEYITLGNRRSDGTAVYLSQESKPTAEPKYEWRRSSVEQEEEPAAPVAERQGLRESEGIKSHWDSQQLPVSGFSFTRQTSYDSTDGLSGEDDESSRFTGVFKATFVELVSDPAAPSTTPPSSPEADSPYQCEMDSLVDTLKSMGPSLRPRNMGLRPAPQALLSSLPPIVEDAPNPVTSDLSVNLRSPLKKMEAESLNGLYTLPSDLGLKRSSFRDNCSPLDMMKKSQDLQSPTLNGNGVLPSSATSSRLENSVLFASYRSSSVDQTPENGKPNRLFFHTNSLPETGPSNDRISQGPREHGEPGVGSVGSGYKGFSFLSNSTSSGTLTRAEDPNMRMSQPPPLSISLPPSGNSPTRVLSPTRLLSPTGSIDLHRPFTTTDSPLSMFSQTTGMGTGLGTGSLGTPTLQRSFSLESPVGGQTSLLSNVRGGSLFQNQEPEPDRNLLSKYRAFPDAYLTKEKEHGKLNPRPGKMYIFDRPGMCGQRIEIRSDVIDATPWELQETISIRVVRGGWVLYEKPNFKGEKIALDEGDIELTCPFGPEEEQPQNGQTQGGEHSGETSDEQTETKPARRFIIGSVRRAVRDYSVPEISLFPEENAEGKKVIFRDTSEDARIFGFPIKANSVIINAGLWLVYAQPFFQGVPRVLEVGGYTNPAAWGVENPYVGSLHPLKVGEPRVENTSEPKMVIYDKPYFTGKSRTITSNMRDFMTRTDRQQTVFMYSVGSLKVQGGIWVGYEKEGFRGHQYLLEEGEYHDWRVWGGCDAELRSVRVIRADLTDPLMVMFEQPEEDQEGMQEENTFEVTEAIADVELFEYKTSTRSINVLSGAWIAYSHVDFSGNQYILEKGFYNNSADWGSQDTRICSVQPILLAPSDSSRTKNEITLYSEEDFQGEGRISDCNHEALSEKLLTKSCRVSGGSWVLYENKQYSGNLYVLSEGDYPNLTSMGCPAGCTIRSIKVVAMYFSVPSISLFGLECLEGREITTDTEMLSVVEEGFNNHILSVRVNSGSWVICEHSNYRGRQFLLEPIEITNWLKFSSLQTIGSMYPVRQKRHYFRIKNKERDHFMSVQGGVEEMKSGRVVVVPQVEPECDIWFYQDGLIINKLSPTMSLQVVGNVEPAAKVVLWTQNRQPIQTWTAQMTGLITCLTFPGMVLDVKGGKSYDKDHVVVMPENDERPSQQWEIELL